MKANYRIDAEDLAVIRPLVYTREAHTRDFSLRSRFPVINENCPACFEEPKERARVKRLLSQEEAMIPTLFSNMRKALVPLMASSTYYAMEEVVKEVEARARQSQDKGRGQGAGKKAIKGPAEEEGARGDGGEGSGAVKRDLDPLSREDEVGNILKKIRAEEQCSDGYCVPCYELA
jgi:tRNA(Ile)-lysidine synthase TilS/MesJ